MMRSRRIGILVSLLLLTLAAPLQAVITPSGDLAPTDYSWWHNGGDSWTDAYIGKTGVGSVIVNFGSDLSSDIGYIGFSSGSTGVVMVDGSGSTWTNSGEFFVGFFGHGTLNITNGGAVSDTCGYIGYGYRYDSAGVVTVDGSGSAWTNRSDLYVGFLYHGTLNITNGGAVNVSRDTWVTENYGATGEIHFDGGTLTTKSLFAGATQLTGTGTINTHGLVSDADLLFDSAHAPNQTFTLNSQPGQNITINLSQDSTGYLGAGYIGNGTISIRDGVSVESDTGFIGYKAGATGEVTVNGSGSTWTNSGKLYVGYDGQGTLNITNGGAVSNNSFGYIGCASCSNGVVTVDGNGSTWTNSNSLSIGSSGQGTLNIAGGGVVNVSHDIQVARYDGTGEIHFDGGTLTTESLLAGATHLTGTGTINTHGLVSDVNLLFDSAHAPNQTLTLNSLPGQNITINLTQDSTGYLGAGYAGNGTLAIRDGVSVESYKGYIGYKDGANGVVTVDGSGSTWTSSSSICVGIYGQGTLNITNGGSVSASYGYIGSSSSSTGLVTVDGSGSTWTTNNWLDVGCYLGQGTLNITNGGAVIGERLKVRSGGTVNLTGGTLTAGWIAHTAGGAFNFTGGRLNVRTFSGDLVNNGGTLAPGTSPGITNVSGNYTQASDGVLQIEIGGLTPGDDHDQVAVSNAANLAGMLDLSLIGEYVPDFYDEFEILTAGTLNGTFDTITGVAADPDLYLAVVYNADNVTVVAAIPGDANLEGNVDDSDLSILLSNFDDSGTWSTGDFNGDGNSGDADLSILLSNFGSTSITSEGVPEPATLCLMGLGSLALLRRRK